MPMGSVELQRFNNLEKSCRNAPVAAPFALYSYFMQGDGEFCRRICCRYKHTVGVGL
jgi:hypothetical protein